MGPGAQRFLVPALICPKGLVGPWPEAGRSATLREIRQRKRTGVSLRPTKMAREQWGQALFGHAKVLFGSWNDALLAADISIDNRGPKRASPANASNRATFECTSTRAILASYSPRRIRPSADLLKLSIIELATATAPDLVLVRCEPEGMLGCQN